MMIFNRFHCISWQADTEESQGSVCCEKIVENQINYASLNKKKIIHILHFQHIP